MERYLLFESACPACADLAHSIEKIANGWLISRSIRDQEMQALLIRGQPDWRWQPTLLVKSDGHVKVFTGLGLALQLALGLGVKRSVQVLQLIERVRSSQADQMASGRRSFLKAGSLFMAGLLNVPVSLKAKPELKRHNALEKVKPEEIVGEQAQVYIRRTQASQEFALIQDKVLPVNAEKAMVLKYIVDDNQTKHVVVLPVSDQGYVHCTLIERHEVTGQKVLHSEVGYYAYEHKRGGADFVVGSINGQLIARNSILGHCGQGCGDTDIEDCEYCTPYLIREVEKTCCACPYLPPFPPGIYICCCIYTWRGPCRTFC